MALQNRFWLLRRARVFAGQPREAPSSFADSSAQKLDVHNLRIGRVRRIIRNDIDQRGWVELVVMLRPEETLHGRDKLTHGE